MAVESWDLDDYDPWDEWYEPDDPAVQLHHDTTMRMCGKYEDKAWAECDEERYLAALLVAGAEPISDEAGLDERVTDRWQNRVRDILNRHDQHRDWQARVISVLMHKYRHHWWYEWTIGGRVHSDPRYRHKADTCRLSVQEDELHKFYTWLCSQRGEPWTVNIVPY